MKLFLNHYLLNKNKSNPHVQVSLLAFLFFHLILIGADTCSVTRVDCLAAGYHEEGNTSVSAVSK
jgi:hypothetical protein